MALSNNPNETSSRASTPESILRYPLTEDLSISTSLRFIEYSRLHPDSELNEFTNTIITLPIPITITDASSIRVGNSVDLETFGNITPENASKITRMASGETSANIGDITEMGRSMLAQSLKNGFGAIQQNALRGLAVAPGMGDLRTPIQVYAGVVANPHTTLLFEGVGLKPFNLEWRLSARSLDESIALKNIVDKIKERTHPEELTNGFALNYPDLVLVEFNGKPSNFLPKFQKAFINSVVISTDSGSGLSFYNSGAPTAVNIQLSCQEINIVTRDTLKRQRNGTV